MSRLFGTDGVRGLAGGEVLTPELALSLARSAARALGAGVARRRPVVAIGRDTRPSGALLESAAAAGFAAQGCDVALLGVVPTPAVAHACASGVADLGLVVSASHNPMADNGLKLFAGDGGKLPDELEDRIEAGLGEPGPAVTGAAVGTVAAAPPGWLRAYEEHLLTALDVAPRGLHVVVDCAQGAASALAPRVYARAGARVTAIHADGDGLRINDGCGATHLQSLQEAVVAAGADLGLAHDGDADRCLAVDAQGRVLDGDRILAVLALGMREQGRLTHDTLVATVMSNLGLLQAMRAAGVTVETTAVGDRYVLERMRQGGFVLGGEQSGHVVRTDLATTGDGLLTGLSLLSRMAATGAPLAELAGVVTVLPQVLVNVRAQRARAQAPEVVQAVAAQQAALGDDGRVLLRPSGTEPLVRIMVEAPTTERAREVAQALAAVVAR